MTGDVQITVEVGGSGNRYISAPCGCHFTITGTLPRTRITWNCPHYRGVYVPLSDPPMNAGEALEAGQGPDGTLID